LVDLEIENEKRKRKRGVDRGLQERDLDLGTAEIKIGRMKENGIEILRGWLIHY
jgi:hypothetical protein